MNDDSPGGLTRLAFGPLPVGTIRPAGWLARQLHIQADGLTGHLDEFWPDIQRSGWVGGDAEGWERGPYWLDGLVPLAFLLDDETLKGKVRRWMDHILAHQIEDGWLGPETDEHHGNRDPWPVFVMLKAMSQYCEATGDRRVVAAMRKFLRCLDAQLADQPLHDWNRMRFGDLLVSIYWLYDLTGEQWLLDLAGRAYQQGFDWRRHFEDLPYKDRVGKWEHESHVVNNAMGIKTPGVWYRQSNDRADREASMRGIAALDAHHGQFTGVFTGDECLAGKNPSQGTELCAVVEYMYSLEVLLAVLGAAAPADRLERIAFNALPATFKPDMWAHQYDQQANQVICQVEEKPVYTTNGAEANLFGLEPNFGCCTANMHQGWPKFATHLWMRAPDGGLAAVAYAPSTVTTHIAGAKVTVRLDTDYPFGEALNFTVRTDRPVTFDLHLRIPAWADGAKVTLPDETIPGKPGSYLRIARRWTGSTRAQLELPMRAAVRRRHNNAVAVERGPLVYSLKIGEDWRKLRGREPHADWEVYPTTNWNYSLEIDESDPAASISFQSGPVGDCPFSPAGAPIRARVKGRRVKDWKIVNAAAAPPPAGPVGTDEPLEDLTLIPYGCTNLRVTEFPLAETVR